MKTFFAGIVGMFLGAGVFYSTTHASTPDTLSAGSGFTGHVEVHTYHMAPAEDLIQIIDSDRAVVCYGKVSQGGGASVSCQKSK